MGDKPPTLLCVSNMKSTRGYAWYFIGRLYAQVADHLATHGVRTLVAYPSIPEPPPALAGSAAEAVLLDASLESLGSLRAVARLVRSENVRVIYFTDRPACSWKYFFLRRAGIRRIIVHDHTSGERTRPRGLKRLAKSLLARIPSINPDVTVAVSHYVARRQVEVNLLPVSRVVTVWHGLPVKEPDPDAGQRVRAMFGLAAEGPIIVCSCRATPEKGIDYLLRAFDRVIQGSAPPGLSPTLIYIGDGPQLKELQSLRDSLRSKDAIIFAGYRRDAAEIIQGADVCITPSVWQEAFGLSVLEAMARGKPVIATRVGGIPELVEDGVDGLLVPPADEAALAQAIVRLLSDPEQAARLGEAARRTVAERFSPQRQIHQLTALIEEGFETPCEAVGG